MNFKAIFIMFFLLVLGCQKTSQEKKPLVSILPLEEMPTVPVPANAKMLPSPPKAKKELSKTTSVPMKTEAYSKRKPAQQAYTLKEAEQLCKDILGKLWEAYGYLQSDGMPLLDVVPDTTIKGAGFFPGTKEVTEDTSYTGGVIIIDYYTFLACQELGEDSLEDALAFIIGHELGHYFQFKKNPTLFCYQRTDFIAHAFNKYSNGYLEDEVDLFGAICAHFAGYQLENILPKLMESLYKKYDLIGKENLNYPNLEDRKKTASKVEKKLLDLIELFRVTPYLTAGKFYKEASIIYDFISDFYHGKEIWNNKAMNLINQSIDLNEQSNYIPYAYLIEHDMETRLRKPLLRHHKGIEKIRLEYLREAEKALIRALEIDANYQLAQLNLTSLWAVRDAESDFRFLEQAYNNHKNKAPKDSLQKAHFTRVKLNYYTAAAKRKHNLEHTLKTLDSMSIDQNRTIRNIATYNLAVAQGSQTDSLLPQKTKFPSHFTNFQFPAHFCHRDVLQYISIHSKPQPKFCYHTEPNHTNIAFVFSDLFSDLHIYIKRYPAKPNIDQQIESIENFHPKQNIFAHPLGGKGKHIGFNFHPSGELLEWFQMVSITRKKPSTLLSIDN